MRLHRGLAAVPFSLLAIGLATILALSGCSSFSDAVAAGSSKSAPASTKAAEPKAKSIKWTDCSQQFQPQIAGQPGSDRNLKFDCGHTDVPISYEEPKGATLPLFLVRVVMAGQTGRIGSLVVNPGGPGASGADAAIGLALTLPTDVMTKFDIVGFDPRGVGLSTPVQCISDDMKERLVASEPRPMTDAQLTDHFALTKEVADGCAKQYGDALGTFNTVATARDMEQLRQSLGDDKLTYLGYSYGTTLGSTYAELFPDKVRAFVLDGAVDPDSDEKARAEAHAQGLEAGFDAFANNCVGLIAGCPVSADPRGFLNGLLGAAARTAIPSSEPGEKRQATPGVIMKAVQAGLYDTASWPQLAQGLAAASRGDSKGLFSLADGYSGRLKDGKYSNLLDANRAINCADTDQKFTETEIRGLAADWGQKYPLFGAGSAAGLSTCSVWKAHRTPLPKRDAQGSPPIVVVGNTGDPVTPEAGAQDMAKDLTSGVLLVWQGQGHTAYPKTPCITDAVDNYLINLAPPADGLTCPA
jgi:pimeloyl-ACP methyl ester carboxylesterase